MASEFESPSNVIHVDFGARKARRSADTPRPEPQPGGVEFVDDGELPNHDEAVGIAYDLLVWANKQLQEDDERRKLTQGWPTEAVVDLGPTVKHGKAFKNEQIVIFGNQHYLLAERSTPARISRRLTYVSAGMEVVQEEPLGVVRRPAVDYTGQFINYGLKDAGGEHLDPRSGEFWEVMTPLREAWAKVYANDTTPPTPPAV